MNERQTRTRACAQRTRTCARSVMVGANTLLVFANPREVLLQRDGRNPSEPKPSPTFEEAMDAIHRHRLDDKFLENLRKGRGSDREYLLLREELIQVLTQVLYHLSRPPTQCESSKAQYSTVHSLRAGVRGEGDGARAEERRRLRGGAHFATLSRR